MKSDTKLYHPFERVDRYRIKSGQTWKQVAERLGISVAMLMMTKTGKRNISEKVIARLESAEKEAGLAPVETQTRSRDLDIYENLASIFLEQAFREKENCKIALKPEHHDQGWVELPLEYNRGMPPAGFPSRIRLTRPPRSEVMKLLREVDEVNDPQLLLYACLPSETRNPDFLEKLSPICVLLMEDAAAELTFGKPFYQRATSSEAASEKSSSKKLKTK